MSGKGLSYGLNITKEANGSRPQPAKRKPIFDEDDDSDGENNTTEAGVEEIGEVGGISTGPKSSQQAPRLKVNKSKPGAPGLKKLFQ